MTPVNLIRQAILNSGVALSQTIYAEEIYRAFDLLNMMLAQWNRKRWLVYHLLDVWASSTGTATYIVGPGGDFDTPRPDRIEAAFARYISAGPIIDPFAIGVGDIGVDAIQDGTNVTGNGLVGAVLGGFVLGIDQLGPEASGYDYPLTVFHAREDYNRAVMKGLISVPYCVFYDSDWPVGKLHLYPSPSAGLYEIHLTLKAELTQFANLTTDINLPPEYLDALMWNLSVRLRAASQASPDKEMMMMAAAALSTIQNANAQIPRAMMPSSLPIGRSRFNIYSGRHN